MGALPSQEEEPVSPRRAIAFAFAALLAALPIGVVSIAELRATLGGR